MRKALVVMLLLAACSDSGAESRHRLAPDDAVQVDGHPTLWKTADGTIYGPCADVRPYIATINPEPGFACD